MPSGAQISSLDLPFVYASYHGVLGMADSFDDAQQHCQEIARSPLSWSRFGRRWIAMDTTTNLMFTIEQLLF